MNNKSIRLQNLRLLVEERGTIAAVAAAAETSESYLSQILNRHPLPSGRPRNVGDHLARKLESGCGKEEGWMDKTLLPDSQGIFLAPDEQIIMARYRRASPKVRRLVQLALDLDGN